MEIPDNLKWISEVEGIDVPEGLRNCGMPEQFIKFVRTFYDTLDVRIRDIEGAHERGDIEMYTIKVHSLKSTARIMGAKELSVLAEELENAGDHGDTGVIDEKTPLLLDICSAFKEKLSPIETTVGNRQSDTGNRPAIAPDNLENAYSAIREFVPQMDYDAVEMVLSELNEYTLPQKDEEFIKKLTKLLNNFDWDGMEAMLSEH